jgi:hypothetical protein
MFSGLAGIEHHPARRWTATASFMLQSALVMGAFIYPLLHLNVLPETLLRPRIFVPVSNGEVRPETAGRDRVSGPSPGRCIRSLCRPGSTIGFRRAKHPKLGSHLRLRSERSFPAAQIRQSIQSSA